MEKQSDDTEALSELPAYLNCTFTLQYIPACHMATMRALMNSPVYIGGLRLFRHEKILSALLRMRLIDALHPITLFKNFFFPPVFQTVFTGS